MMPNAKFVMFCAVSWDLLVRKVHDARQLGSMDISKFDEDLRAMLQGSHSLSVPGLGLTMADGGERVEPSKPEASDEKSQK